MATSPPNEFWSFSIRFYRQRGVAEACLTLQDRVGIDVNVLLFCLWTARHGISLSPATLKAAVALSGRWSKNVVKPLRGVRTYLKPLNLPELRKEVLRVELTAERRQQDMLRDLVGSVAEEGRGDSAMAARHIDTYFALARLPQKRLVQPLLAGLVTTAFAAFAEPATDWEI